MPSYTFPIYLMADTTAANWNQFVNGNWVLNNPATTISFSDDDTLGLGDDIPSTETSSPAIITHVGGSTSHPLVGQPIYMAFVRSDDSDGDTDNNADTVFLSSGGTSTTFGAVSYPSSGWSMNPGDTFTSGGPFPVDDHTTGGSWSTEGFPEGTVAEIECIFFDAIVHPGGMAAINEDMETASGDLLAVHEPVSLTLFNPPIISGGDTVVIGGVPWSVTNAIQQGCDVTYDGGSVQGSASFIVIEMTDGTETMTYYIPADGQDFCDITEITPVTTPGFIGPQCSSIDDDDKTTLSMPPPDPCVLYDFIETTVALPNDGDALSHAGGELVGGIDEPVSFGGGADPTAIEVGEAMYVGGNVYQVSGLEVHFATVTHSGGTVDTSVQLLAVEVTDGTDTWTYYVPTDGTNYPDITNINVTESFAVKGNQFEKDAFVTDDNVEVICFAQGTGIATITGTTSVEDLAVGDKVLTADNGYQAIRWIGQRTVPATGHLAPVVLSKGTFGANADLKVSPQHRVLINDWRAEVMFGTSEALVPAKHLVNGDTIYRESGGEVTYFHVLFDSHEIIFAEGVATESFHPGENAIAGLEDDVREELFELFPELAKGEFSGVPAARISLKKFEVDALYA
ncbi:MAG: Hint domain-containing protein [Planktomarina sp.]